MELIFSNHLIVQKIMTHLTWKEWKDLRRVCTVWNEVIVKRFMVPSTLLKVKIPPQESIEEDLLSSISSHILFHDIHIILNGDYIPPECWELFLTNCTHLRIEGIFGWDHIEGIVRLGLHQLKELTLVVTKKCMPSSSFNQNNDNELKPLIGLESFKFLNLTSSESEDSCHAPCPLPLPQLFILCPQLKNLTVVGLRLSEVGTLLDTIGTHSRLETLEIYDENPCSEFLNSGHLSQLCHSLGNLRSLSMLGLELSFNFGHGFDPSSHPCFQDLASSSVSTLRQRRFPLPLFHQPFNSFPIHNRLKTLYISEGMFRTLEFLSEKLPSLTALHIELRDRRTLTPIQIFSDLDDRILKSHPTLTTVVIDHPFDDGPQTIRRLSDLCPFLEDLKCRMDNTTAWALWEKRPQFLRKLHIISWDEFTDEGLFGIGRLPALTSLTLEIWRSSRCHIGDESLLGLSETRCLHTFTGIRTDISEDYLDKFLPEGCKWKLME